VVDDDQPAGRSKWGMPGYEEPTPEQLHEASTGRVWVDFNSGFDRGDEDGRYFRRPSLTTAGSRADLARLKITLRPGMALKVWMDDWDADNRWDPLVALGTVDFTPDQGWVVDVAATDTYSLSEAP
jgi:hypothetical protein